jgi:trehalose 6-phosphate phosphatase
MTSVDALLEQSATLPPPPHCDLVRSALFVDIDGTLLDIALRPDEVVVDDRLRVTLRMLQQKLGGALAIVSGRPLHDIDALFGLDVAAAGLHGAELRGPHGEILAKPVVRQSLEAARKRALECAAQNPGVLVEDKRSAIALHYRTAPLAEIDVRRAALDMLAIAGDAYELLDGKSVIELKPRDANKGTALAALMRLAPFAGRAPWMFGDDVTDEDAFVQADAEDGVSIIVGPRRPTLARHALRNPTAMRAWLGALVEEARTRNEQ